MNPDERPRTFTFNPYPSYTYTHDVTLEAMRRERDEDRETATSLARENAALREGLRHAFLVFLWLMLFGVIGLIFPERWATPAIMLIFSSLGMAGAVASTRAATSSPRSPSGSEDA